MKIRLARPEDAGNFIRLQKDLAHETKFMLPEVDEIEESTEVQANRIRSIMESENKALFIAVENNQLIGFCAALGGGNRRNFHCCHVVIGVSQNFHRQGVGKKLLNKITSWAFSEKIKRLELTVMTHNEAAISLYKKSGYEIEGLKKNSVCIDGRFADEYLMAKMVRI